MADTEQGGQVELAHGGQRVAVVTLGGGLRSYEVGGLALLDGFPAGERPTSGRGQVLAPWPNRIENGSYDFDGKQMQLPLTEPEHGNAIHGLVRGATWSVVDLAPDRVVMQYVLEPEPGYPFMLALSIEYALSDAGLAVTTTAHNIGAERCPYGCGQHPYLTLGTPTVDRLGLQVPAREVVFSDERGLPERSLVGRRNRIRLPRGADDRRDRPRQRFTELERGDDGRARVLLDDPDSGIGPDALGRRELPLAHGLHRGPAPRRRAAQRRGRADDLPAERVPHRRRADPAGPGESTASTWGIEPRLAVGGSDVQ